MPSSHRRVAGIAAGAIFGLLGPALALAHHSTAEYDSKTFVEARGEVVSVLWRNPHVRFQVSTKDIDGNDGSGISRVPISRGSTAPGYRATSSKSATW